MHRLVLACFLALCACGGSSAPAPDAGNGTFGAACTMVSDSSAECTSGVCTGTIDMAGHPVCSVKCTFGMDSTCPSGSMGMKCNKQGYCRP